MLLIPMYLTILTERHARRRDMLGKPALRLDESMLKKTKRDVAKGLSLEGSEERNLDDNGFVDRLTCQMKTSFTMTTLYAMVWVALTLVVYSDIEYAWHIANGNRLSFDVQVNLCRLYPKCCFHLVILRGRWFLLTVLP